MTLSSPDYRIATMPTPTLFELVTECSACYTSTSPRQIRPPSRPDVPWITVSYDTIQLPSQGWKLHIAASSASAERVLRLVLPVLFQATVSFKVLGSLQDLEQLNNGSAGLSQIGKFITIYPRDDDEAVRLATRLDMVTHGIPGPVIPSDRRLRPGSIVSYRYGGFQFCTIQTAWGAYREMLQTPTQELIPDPRYSTYIPPDWAIDPFSAAGVAEELPTPQRIIADRYLLLITLYQSAQTQIHLAIDLQMPRRCIVKCPGLGFLPSDRVQEDVTYGRLLNEAQALAAVAHHPGFPRCYDLQEEQGTVFLVLEDIDGETLAQHVQRYTAQGYKTPRERIVGWGLEIASMLKVLHDQGMLYRDLKTTNVMVTPDGQLRLIDLGLVQPINSKPSAYGLGTEGYMSPQQLRGELATISDDIYGLGALLYFLATGAEPSLAPRGVPLTVRPLHLLHPTLDPALIVIIERCLHPDPNARFTSIDDLEVALEAQDLGRGGTLRAPSDLTTPASQADSRGANERGEVRGRTQGAAPTPFDYRQLARCLGETLSQAAQRDPQGSGLRWTSSHYVGKGTHARDINMGTSGSLLALAEVVAEFGDVQQRHVLAEGARGLIAAERLSDPPLAGLYVGEAGVGTALLRAGQVLEDHELITRALEHARWVATLPFGSADLFNGTAGRVRFHLWLWAATADAQQLQMAIDAGERLLASAETTAAGGMYWSMPVGYGKMSGSVFLGYAHGAAGIADSLLDLYEVTQQGRFLVAARAAGCWLQQQAVATLDDASGLIWPDTEGAQPCGTYWCHGTTGIGIFFLHAAHLDVLAGAREMAKRAAQTVAYGNRACGPVQCHGLAGNIEFLLDMAQYMGEQKYREEAFELAALLEAFAVEKAGKLLWSSEAPITFTPDYMIGYAGIIGTLLRLADSLRPRQLSRRGLFYKSTLHAL